MLQKEPEVFNIKNAANKNEQEANQSDMFTFYDPFELARIEDRTKPIECKIHFNPDRNFSQYLVC
jgi:hypothetical protein